MAGRFYPSQREALKKTVEEHIARANVVVPTPNVAVVVAPHAGYPYSGPTAGHAFRRVLGTAPSRVILLGPSHHFRFPGLSIYPSGAWKTPLGTVEVDADFAAQLVSRFGNTCPEAHAPEHALEVELPFLQVALKSQFTIVPILLGSDIDDTHDQLAECLVEWTSPEDLLIASTDLSHFLTEAEANAIDQRSLDTLVAGDPAALAQGISQGACAMCGASAVYTSLAAANLLGATRRQRWDYRTSGAATRDYARVVGYGAVTLEYLEETTP